MASLEENQSTTAHLEEKESSRQSASGDFWESLGESIASLFPGVEPDQRDQQDEQDRDKTREETRQATSSSYEIRIEDIRAIKILK